MNIRQLKTFVAVADAGGLAEAEGRLNLSQPAATRQIQALEREYGILLFDRIGRRLHLTSVGAEFLHASRAILREADVLGERVQAVRQGRAGRLRVGASPQHVEVVLAGFLPEFIARHGSVELELIEDGGSRLAERLDRGDIHLALIAAGDTRHTGLALADGALLAVTSRSHGFAASRCIDVRALQGERILALRAGFGSRQWLEEACRAAHFKPEIAFESSAPQTLLALATNGFGVAILPSNVPLAQSSLHAAVLQVDGKSIVRHNVVAWNAQRYLPAYAQDFASELVSHCRETYPGREFLGF